MKTKMLFTSLLIPAAAAMVMTLSTCQKYSTDKPSVKDNQEQTAQELTNEGTDNGDAPKPSTAWPKVTLTPAYSLGPNWIASGATVSVPTGAPPITARGMAIGPEYSLAISGKPINNATIINCGTGSGTFEYRFEGLTENEVYSINAWAQNSAGYGSDVNEIWSPTSGSSSDCDGQTTITDSRDGKVYRITQVENQCWMADNLNVGIWKVGGAGINSDPANGIIEKFCFNNLETNCNIYGGLYQWDEIMNQAASSNTNPSNVQGICPTGWHIPSFSEISQLSMAIGGTGRTANSGGKLKEMSTAHWKKGNTGATNEYGFNSIGSGYYHPGSATAPYFTGLKEEVKYWSSTNWWSHDRYDQSFYFRNHYNVGYQYHFSIMRTFGHSVRCVKDPTPPTLP